MRALRRQTRNQVDSERAVSSLMLLRRTKAQTEDSNVRGVAQAPAAQRRSSKQPSFLRMAVCAACSTTQFRSSAYARHGSPRRGSAAHRTYVHHCSSVVYALLSPCALPACPFIPEPAARPPASYSSARASAPQAAAVSASNLSICSTSYAVARSGARALPSSPTNTSH